MIPPEDDALIRGLNEELLAAAAEEKDSQNDQVNKARRNSKQDIINKILKTSEDFEITVEHSDTKLNRMTKTQLNKVLANTIEKGMQQKMAEQVGVDRNASEKLIALGALRMIHNLAASAAEQGLNSVLPAYGYQIDGFASKLDTPPIKEAVDACLEEIARESDVLGYIESPFARLGLAWSGALITCMKPSARPCTQKNRNSLQNAATMESRTPNRQNPI
jgi:hypothetical protein